MAGSGLYLPAGHMEQSVGESWELGEVASSELKRPAGQDGQEAVPTVSV